MKRTKLSTTLLLGAVLIGMIGCGGSDNNATDASGGDSVAGDGGQVTITMWHANVDVAADTMQAIADKFHAANPNITVKVDQGATGDTMLTKLTTVLSTGSYPDIAYVFGTDTPALSRSDKVVDLTEAVKDPAFGWDDFYEGERAVATVDGKVVAVPALVDNLALVYNKQLFADAGVPEPTADWSWDDYRTAAKELTDIDNKIFGASYPVSGDEDTVWRFWPMIWQQGAKGISDDGKTSTFDDPAFATALELLRSMAVDDKSMLIDPSSETVVNLFETGKIAMTITGPWALYDITAAKIDYGVVPVPAFNGDHRTVSGPDNWMVFDNGDARSAAAIKFLQFLAQPEQDAVWNVGIGNMPIRNATKNTPEWAAAVKATPAYQVFLDNFANSKDARPQTIVYPAYSAALGEQIAAVLLGQASVEDALKAAKANADAALADG
jgi:multiple sugar transport system substrate-binding protein